METPYDLALKEVGDSGKFQKRFDILYNVVFVGIWISCYYNIYLILPSIPHHCKITDTEIKNQSEDSWKEMYIPRSIDTTGQLTFSECLKFKNPEMNNETEECDDYIFDQTWYDSTIVSDNKWVCNKEIYVANTMAYSKGAEAIMSVALGRIGDVYGRRVSYSIALAMIIAGRLLIVVASDSYVCFVIGCVISFGPAWTVIQSVTVLSIEISSVERRNKVNAWRTYSCTLSICIMPLIFWWLRSWKPFIITTTVGLVPFMIMSWKFIESPRWLWQEGRVKQCLDELKKIAKHNGNRLSEDTIERLKSTPLTEQKSYGALALLSNFNIAKNTILSQLIWIIIALGYNSMIMNVGGKGNNNPHLSFASQSAAELPGNFLGAMLCDKIGRRKTALFAFTCTSLLWGMDALSKNITSTWIPFGLSMLIRTSHTVSYYALNLMSMEIYPTCVRQFGMSLSGVFASLGGAISYYVIYLGHQVHPSLLGIILAISSLLAVACTYFLPETLNTKLPETLEDTRYFGRQRKSNRGTLERDDQEKDKNVELSKLTL